MKLKFAVAVAAAAALGLAGCGSDSGSDDGDAGTSTGDGALVVGVVPSANVAPLYLGVEKGMFEDKGLKLDLRPAQGFSANVASVSNGETDIGFGTTVPIVGAIANGVPIKIVANSDVLGDGDGEDNSGLFVPPGSDIKSINDLEGKTVAVNALANVFDVALKKAMTDAGADPSKVKFLEVALPDMVAALDTKRVDAAAMGEPFVTLSRNAGNTEILKPFGAGFALGAPIASYFVSDDFAEEHADEVAKFQEALDEASQYAAANSEEARSMMKQYTEIPAPVLKDVALGKYQSPVDLDSLQTVVDTMVATDTIPDELDAETLVVQ